MKLNEVRPSLETAGELEEQFFSIQDQGMIFDILRNKMYSNPILAICREVSCNARDAHREVGTPELPVRIHLPNNLEQYYKIKDFGPGISPDRMSNIFIKYTASTKRHDNTQTGGFGLGAKTPFSYSDSFSITTNHNGIQYNYSCNIDETRVGKLMLMSESPTNEPNGTEILIPVLPKDFSNFSTWTEQATRHWDVKPTIKGGTINYEVISKILEGSNWAIAAAASWQRNAKMIIDGIEYPLELDSLKKYADSKLIDAAKGNFIMYFGVGELSLSASREQIYLDEQTQKKIRDRLDLIYQEIKQKVVDKINSFPNLWLANIYYRKELKQAFSDLGFLGQLDWNGIPLSDGYVYTLCPTYNFSKGKYSHRRNADPNKLHRGNNTHLSFDETSDLYINDLTIKEPTPRHVKKAFDDNKDLKSVQVVCPSDKVTLADLIAKISFDKMQPKLLSSITKAHARAHTVAVARLLLFKFDVKSAAFRQISYADMEKDGTEKVLCNLVKVSFPATRQPILKNKKVLTINSVKALSNKFPTISFYGVDDDAPEDRIEEEFSDLDDIDGFIQDKVLDNQTVDFLKTKFATYHNYRADERLLKIFNKIRPMINETQSLYNRRHDLHNLIKSLSSGDLELLHIYESINGEIDAPQLAAYKATHPELDIESINEEFDKKYPLLKILNLYNCSEHIDDIAQYVNLVDKA